MESKSILVGLNGGRVTHLSINTSNDERIAFINNGCDSVVLIPADSDVPDFKASYQIKLVSSQSIECSKQKIGAELQSFLAKWSFRAKNGNEDFIVVDANLAAKYVENLTGASA